MSSSPTVYPLRGIFQPRFILPNELSLFALPDANRQPAILSLVDAASELIDVYCGRVDGTGQGSLVYTTYIERLLLQARNRNILRVSFKPMVALSQNYINLVTASANNVPLNKQGQPLEYTLLTTNYYWNGAQAANTPLNTMGASPVPGSTLSPILGCSGRYGYARRSEFAIYPDLNYGMNLLQVASFFGGPPNFTAIPVASIDFDVASGEIWVPAGIYLSQYTEIVIIYTSGYDPLNMPRAIKHACAALVRNYLSRGGGVTGLRSIQTGGAVNVSFSQDLIDTTIERMLDPYKNVIAY